jgi:hypothetical protein
VSWQRGRPPLNGEHGTEVVEGLEDVVALTDELRDEVASDIRDDEEEVALLHLLTDDGTTQAMKVLAVRRELRIVEGRRHRHVRELKSASAYMTAAHRCLLAIGYEHFWPTVQTAIAATLRDARQRIDRKQPAKEGVA